jgi:chloramphenicol-sensitive protein RarD
VKKTPRPPEHSETSAAGTLFALAAFLIWGSLPLYWKLLKDYPAEFVLSHRIVWSAVFLAVFILFRGSWKTVIGQLSQRETWIWLVPSTLLIGANWYIYIWAVNNNFVIETSLGYFLAPLATVMLGGIFLGERLRRWQKFAVGLVAIAVIYLLWNHGKFPWIAFGLAATFSLYGLAKKKMKSDSLASLTHETWLLFLPAALVIVTSSVWTHPIPRQHVFLLIGAGIVTSVPLYLFGRAARLLSLSTLGLFQYLTPTFLFAIAVFILREPLPLAKLISFVIIWIALAIYTWDSLNARPSMTKR